MRVHGTGVAHGIHCVDDNRTDKQAGTQTDQAAFQKETSNADHEESMPGTTELISPATGSPFSPVHQERERASGSKVQRAFRATWGQLNILGPDMTEEAKSSSP